MQVLAIHDMLRDEVVAVPDPDRPLMDSDTIIVSGTEEDLARLARL